MNFEQQMKLQAYLDGELSSREQEEIRALIDRDVEAKALVQELTWARNALAANEPAAKVPDSREFYWSKISREIERQERAGERRDSTANAPWWRHYFAPLGALTAALVLTFVLLQGNRPTDLPIVAANDAALDSGSDMGAITFQDHSEGITMIWLYDDTGI